VNALSQRVVAWKPCQFYEKTDLASLVWIGVLLNGSALVRKVLRGVVTICDDDASFASALREGRVGSAQSFHAWTFPLKDVQQTKLA
jgi:hypothetical protein